ncbi:MAG TPA: hypothetical protein VHW23_00930 [Kofleriaceae bacterium]|nr:hypothetical protein [Kofleriaceae bacterium]
MASRDPMATAASSHHHDIEKLKHETHDAYVGVGAYAQKGILDHKLDAVDDMQAYLIQVDSKKEKESIAGFLLEAALAVAIPAGAVELAAAVEVEELGTALIEGGGDVVSKLPGVFLKGSDGGHQLLDPVAFCSNIKSALRLGWPHSVKKLTSRMSTLDKARAIHKGTVNLAKAPATVKKAQYAEVLDSWVNALKAKAQHDKVGGMGNADFRSASTGRLHITGIKLMPPQHGRGAVTFAFDHLGAKLDGVPEGARNLLLERSLKDIKVARTITGFGVVQGGGRTAPPPANFAVGVLPDNKLDIHPDTVTPIAQAQLAGISGSGGDWKTGLSVIWNAIQGYALKDLGVSSVGAD